MNEQQASTRHRQLDMLLIQFRKLEKYVLITRKKRDQNHKVQTDQW
jgi:hypothetical protein